MLKNPNLLESAPSESSRDFQIPRFLAIALAGMVALELVAPFTSTSYGLDGRFHLYWISQFTEFIANGVFIPRWIPNSFNGFGSTAFYFYPPLTFYVAALIRTITGFTDAHTLYRIINILGTIGSFIAIQILLRALGVSGKQLVIAACLYTFAPFRLAEIYHRSALPTHVAYVFIPLFWRALLAIVRREWTTPKRILILGFIAALLLLTNLPVIMVTVVCTTIAGAVLWKKIRWGMVMELTGATIVAAGLAAFHYAASLSATPYVAVGVLMITHPKEDIRYFFSNFNLLADYHIFFVYAPVVLFAISYWYVRRKRLPLTEAECLVISIGLAGTAIIAFLDFPPTGWRFWNITPPLRLIAFPLRFYSQILLLTAVLVGIASTRVFRCVATYCIALCVAGAILPAVLAVLNLHVFKHAEPSLEDDWAYRPKYPIERQDLIRVISLNNPIIIKGVQPNEGLQSIRSVEQEEAFKVTFNTAHVVSFHRFYWPYWHLYINGTEIPSQPDSSGRATAVLPAGHYTADWRLERTPIETAGLWISGVAWSGVAIFWGIGLIRRRVRKKQPIVTS
jgi:hypothetical protein